MLIMLLTLVLIFSVVDLGSMSGTSKIYHYDAFRGTPLMRDDLEHYEALNITSWCVSDVRPCDPHEGRRLDETCNNLRYPTRGAAKTPFARLLPAVYDKGFEPRTSVTGHKLPLARLIRTSLLADGKVSDSKFTHLMTYFFVFVAADSIVLRDTLNYVFTYTKCCKPEGKYEPMCIPTKIPADDPIFRYSGHRCQNLTRPETFQTTGCIDMNSVPERINLATPPLDLSTVYGTTLETSLQKGRSYKDGLLRYEIEEGRVWPPNNKNIRNDCTLNEYPRETRCHEVPDLGMNSLLGINLFGIWFWREHNRIASKLALLNPCWNDTKLFYTARDINIAQYIQILYYEMLPALMGYENLVRDGVLSKSQSFRDVYDEDIVPQTSVEYVAVLRWVHLMQEGTIQLFKPSGYNFDEVPIVNVSLRTGFLAIDNNLDYITQGSFRQASAKADYVVDPDISNRGLGRLQNISDITSNDLKKNRYFGFFPYVKYLEYCRGRSYKHFDDLVDVMDVEQIRKLKDVYHHVLDIDLLAGVWVEKLIKGGHVPPTFYCIVSEQLARNVRSDRHWYERKNRPHAFTAAQLQEIRKSSVARFLCDNGDTVTEIQPKPFEQISESNHLHSCSSFERVDLNAWREESCHASAKYEKEFNEEPKNYY